ncbi:DUF721 domain-containing protein [Acinetobacter sp. A3.8]|uniref:DUF721 domain-containing protein n=1 Tax=Acinetobacter sedimenti TaxID=2919922 RepID=A0A9X1WZD3_9GAMM|nr:DUF721 domain-containing protein [Acinetobacter sedimenti]MCJ8146847.1 DUF721 domain-containing protein [Acinetobacter sedimenti]
MQQSKTLFQRLRQPSSQRVGNFTFLQKQVDAWQQLTKLVQPLLPLGGSWQVVCYQHGMLIIAGDNQALISQMRYLQSQYIRNLKAIPALVDVQQIKIVMQSVSQPPSSKKYTRKKRLSNQTQEEIQQAARIVKDAKLSEALIRLASQDQE